MKKLIFIFTITLTILTFILGCGGSVVTNQNQSEFDIPPTGAILTGQSVADPDSSTRPLQSIILAGGNTGSFSGSIEGRSVSGNYTFTIESGNSNGTLELRYNDVAGLLTDATSTLPITFNSLNPTQGAYSGGTGENSRDLGNETGFLPRSFSGLTGSITFL